jgi:hypothetical protein
VEVEFFNLLKNFQSEGFRASNALHGSVSVYGFGRRWSYLEKLRAAGIRSSVSGPRFEHMFPSLIAEINFLRSVRGHG